MTRPIRVTQVQLNYEESSDDEISDSEFDKYRDISKRKMKSYTYQDLENLLEAECPDEFLLIPNITRTITFFPTTAVPGRLPFDPTCSVHLHFGNIESPIPDYCDQVFVHVVGEGNNQIGLVGGEDNTKIDLAQAVLVNPIEPFWYLCSHGRVIDGAEMKRLKALACFLFLASGHVQTVQHYPDFNEDLVDAIVWYGRGLEVQSCGPSKTPVHDYGPIAVSENTMSGDEQRRKGRQFRPTSGHDLPIRAMSEQTNFECEVDQRLLEKKRKIDDGSATSIMTQMQLYYEQLGEHMAMHERECAAMKHNQAETMKLKQRISADAKKHDKLNLQLDIKNAQIRSVKVEIEQLQDRNTHLTQKMARLRVYAESRTAQAEQEKKGRIQAEKRLEEILDAHKKITAMYSGPGK